MPVLRQNEGPVRLRVTPGQVLNIVAPQGSSAYVVHAIDMDPAAVVSGASQAFGPYAGVKTLTVTCTAGAITYDENAAPASAILPASALNAQDVAKVQTLGDPIRFATLGDSIYDIHFNVGVFTMNAVTAWTRRSLGSRASIPGALNLAVSGATLDGAGGTSNVLDQARALAQGAANVALVNIGINSVATMSAAQMQSAASDLIAILKTKVSSIVFACVRIRGAAFPLTGTALARAFRFNRWLTELSMIDPAVKVYDPSPLLIDFTTGQFAAALTTDGTHHTIPGAVIEGLDFASWLAAAYKLPPRNTGIAVNGDTFSAENPSGNLLSNANFTTVSGGNLFNGATGTVPAGFRFSKTSGSSLTAAFSLAPNAAIPSLSDAVITIGGTGDGGVVTLDAYPDITASITAGDLIYAEVSTDLVLPAGFKAVSLLLSIETPAFGALAQSYDGNTVSGQVLPALNGAFTFKTEPFVAPPGFQYLKWALTISGPASGSVAATGRLRTPQVRKLA